MKNSKDVLSDMDQDTINLNNGANVQILIQ